MATLLPLIDLCDNCTVKDTESQHAVPFFVSLPSGYSSSLPVGYILPRVMKVLKEANQLNREKGSKEVWTIMDNSAVTFGTHLDSEEKRSQAMKDLCEYWRDNGFFPDVIGGRLWRNELYPVYYRPFQTKDVAFVMERVCCALFGVITYGAHMTMFTPDYRIWVPTRASTKQTWPGYLDNTVAGGITYGLTPTETIIKECEEEASLPEEFVRSRIKPAGCVSYYYQPRSKTQKDKPSDIELQPELQFIYDLCVPTSDSTTSESITPKPSDGEVESFRLCTIPEILTLMHARRFKPNCALVLIDFLIRHGHVTPENEPNFLEICQRIHGKWWT